MASPAPAGTTSTSSDEAEPTGALDPAELAGVSDAKKTLVGLACWRVATLNLDDRLRPDALHVKTSYMLAHPECDVLSCEVVVTHNATEPYTHRGQRWFTSGGSNRHSYFSDGAHSWTRTSRWCSTRRTSQTSRNHN